MVKTIKNLDLPRVLVIGTAPFSKEISGGRTLGNLFLNYPCDKLGCLYVSDYPLDLIDCSYYLISDQMLLNHFLRFQKIGIEKHYSAKSNLGGNRVSVSRIKRNPLTCLLRERLWRTGVWSTDGLWKWIGRLDPQIIVLSAGPFSFQYDMARIVAEKTGAKLILFNTEDYYFKDWNYLLDSSGWKCLYKRFHRIQRKSIKKAIDCSSLSIYHLDALRDLYRKEFPNNRSAVIYTGSFWKPTKYVPKQDGSFRFSYFGNMDGNRFRSLWEISDVLSEECPKAEFHIYGPAVKDNPAFEAFVHSTNVVYHGIVPYDKVREAVDESDVIVHAVSFDAFNVKDRRNEFSTKIADCLASGRCFLTYAPSGLSFVKYLQKNKAAYTPGSIAELKSALKIVCSNVDARTKFVPNALALAKKNHSVKTNEAIFDSLLEEVGRQRQNESLDILVATCDKSIDEIKDIVERGNYADHVIVGDQNGTTGHVSFVSSKGINVDVYYFNDKGVSKNRNRLFDLSSARFVTFCDDDMSFTNGYERKICQAFLRYKKADVIRFNCLSNNPKRPIRQVKKEGRVGFSELKTFGVWCEIFRSDFLRENNIRFDEKVGPGSLIISGEDVIFNHLVSRSSRFIYQAKSCIALVNQTNSTWFKGYDERYFMATGYVYSSIFGINARLFFALHRLKHKSEYRGISRAIMKKGFSKGLLLFKTMEK
jgi:glycosyltransferase involved in cell wall biosynthesis